MERKTQEIKAEKNGSVGSNWNKYIPPNKSPHFQFSPVVFQHRRIAWVRSELPTARCPWWWAECVGSSSAHLLSPPRNFLPTQLRFFLWHDLLREGERGGERWRENEWVFDHVWVQWKRAAARQSVIVREEEQPVGRLWPSVSVSASAPAVECNEM